MVVVQQKVMFPHQFLKKLWVTWNWSLTSGDNDTFRLKIGRYCIKITPYFFNAIYGEWLDWKRFYLPINLKGATVLDVGAGCGETALFYFLHGAKRVICVEPQEQLAKIIDENIRANRWDAEVLNRSFDLDLLQTEFGFMKMDCEGCEEHLLKASSIPPCVIEVHDTETLSTLKETFGLSLGVGSVQYLIATSTRARKSLISRRANLSP